MSLDKLKLDIRALPYTEMKTLAAELAKAMEGERRITIEPDDIADILVSLPVTSTQEPSMEDTYFRRAFRRKRTLAIDCEANGWRVTCPTIPGAQAAGKDLREVVSRVLDTIFGLKALE